MRYPVMAWMRYPRWPGLNILGGLDEIVDISFSLYICVGKKIM